METTPLELTTRPSDPDSATTDAAASRIDVQTHRATLDSLLALLHDSGDADAIRLCDDLGVPVDSVRRGAVSRGEAARSARALAATLG